MGTDTRDVCRRSAIFVGICIHAPPGRGKTVAALFLRAAGATTVEIELRLRLYSYPGLSVTALSPAPGNGDFAPP